MTPRLTRMEREIVPDLAAGTSTATICAKRHIKPRTLRQHVQSIARKTPDTLNGFDLSRLPPLAKVRAYYANLNAA